MHFLWFFVYPVQKASGVTSDFTNHFTYLSALLGKRSPSAAEKAHSSNIMPFLVNYAEILSQVQHP